MSGLVQADHRFGQGVVIGVAYGSDRGFDTGFGEAAAVADGQVLAGIRMVDQPLVGICGVGSPGPNCLFEGVEGQVGS